MTITQKLAFERYLRGEIEKNTLDTMFLSFEKTQTTKKECRSSLYK